MQLQLTCGVTAQGNAAFLFPFSRLLNRHRRRTGSQQPGATDLAPRSSARRAASSPTSSFPTSGGRVHAHLL